GEFPSIRFREWLAGVECRQAKVGRPLQPDLEVGDAFHFLGAQLKDPRRLSGRQVRRTETEPRDGQVDGKPAVHDRPPCSTTWYEENTLAGWGDVSPRQAETRFSGQR